MRTGSTPPNAVIRPWFAVGEPVRDAVPVVRTATGLGAVGQPYVEPDAGLLVMTESSLIRAYHACMCCPQSVHMPWEEWSEGQWAWYRRRQRVIAQRTIQREERERKKAAP